MSSLSLKYKESQMHTSFTIKHVFRSQNVTLAQLKENLTADDIPFRFGKDSEGNFGYILTDETGADSVIPFNNFDNLELLSSGANGATSPTVINSTVSKSLTATKKGVMIAAVGGGSGASTVIGGLCYKNNVKISPTIQAPSCAPLQAWLIPVNKGDIISISAVGSGSSTTYTSYPMMSCIIGFLA